MHGITTIGCGTLILLAAGFGCASDTVEKPPIVREGAANFTPLRTQDLMDHTKPSASAVQHPLKPIKRELGKELDPETQELLRRHDRNAWMAYKRNTQAKNLDGATRDKLCRLALGSLLEALLRQNSDPLSEEYISRGLDLVAASGTREHTFSAPDGGVREKARRNRNTQEGQLVRLYVRRYDLYRNLLNWLKGCGLNASEVYWTPSFTLLNLELRGLEEKYLQIIGSPNWK